MSWLYDFDCIWEFDEIAYDLFVQQHVKELTNDQSGVGRRFGLGFDAPVLLDAVKLLLGKSDSQMAPDLCPSKGVVHVNRWFHGTASWERKPLNVAPAQRPAPNPPPLDLRSPAPLANKLVLPLQQIAVLDGLTNASSSTVHPISVSHAIDNLISACQCLPVWPKAQLLLLPAKSPLGKGREHR